MSKAWIAFAIAQTGNLVVANEHTKDALGIISRCETRDAQAVKKAGKKRFFGLL